MWFKNVRIYTLDSTFKFSLDELDKLLAPQRFVPCSGQDLVRFGWISPLGTDEDTLCHKIGDDYFFRCKTEKRMLPASVVNEELKEKVEEIELKQARQLKKKEKQDLKEQVITELLPRAFRLHKETWLWISAKYGYVVVNTSSDKQAEDLISLLRKSLGELHAKPFTFKKTINGCLTEWVANGDGPVGIAIGDEVELKSVDGAGGTIKAKKQDLNTDEIRNHLEAGKVVTSLALIINEDISLVVDENFALKRIKLSDTVMDDYATVNDDPVAKLDADLALISGEFTKLIPTLIDSFGGEDLDA
ncbi:MAG: recombination-associated protein RdgC [Ruminobacter sp.]|jgi:recombination associated protein RdgC|nr:recombination-associated protein RdgC [Ruminobacter sp.]